MSVSFYSNLWRVLSLQDHYPQEEAHAELIPWLLWRLWKNRNEFIFQGKEFSAPETVTKAIEDMKEWMGRKEEEKKEATRPISTARPCKWRPPLHDWIKCNTDGAWHKDHQGIGWISRNQSGKLLWAGAQRSQCLRSSIETEAMTLNWAIHSMSRLNYQKVVFETDSLVLARMIAGTEEVWPKLKPIIQDIFHTLSTRPSYLVEYYSRDGNKTADRIAKEAFSFMNHVPKLYSVVPIWLKSVLEADMPPIGETFDVGLNLVGQ